MECDELLNVAYEYARQNERNRIDYLVSSIEKHDHIYWVLFQGVSGLPGDHFTVEVDTRTGQPVRFIPGR